MSPAVEVEISRHLAEWLATHRRPIRARIRELLVDALGKFIGTNGRIITIATRSFWITPGRIVRAVLPISANEYAYGMAELCRDEPKFADFFNRKGWPGSSA